MERLYSLKSILPRGSEIWQNGRILFEIACQTGSNVQILLRFCRETEFRGVVPKLSLGNQEKASCQGSGWQQAAIGDNDNAAVTENNRRLIGVFAVRLLCVWCAFGVRFLLS
jgi:hypothetical protein